MKRVEDSDSGKGVTFGEVMMRLSPPDRLRLGQAHMLEVTFGGSEANVAVALAGWGVPVEHVTALPENDLGRACARFLGQFGVGLEHVVWGGPRLGLYFYERGAAHRPDIILYDRAHSAFATLEPGRIPWPEVFADAAWFHWSGISPAVSASAADVCREAVRAARAAGLVVSCDLNYRGRLWDWGRTPEEVMTELVSLCDVLIGNPGSLAAVFGLDAGEGEKGSRAVSGELARRFPSLRLVAITRRDVRSASHHTWSATLWEPDGFYTAPVYEILPIVDRMGTGDAFTAGLIYGLRTFREDRQRALEFAVAASCLKHSVWGDVHQVSVAEVEAVVRDHRCRAWHV
ncbi:MAG: PfkB family carbohydrate kinase [Anaerolineae bacterium]